MEKYKPDALLPNRNLRDYAYLCSPLREPSDIGVALNMLMALRICQKLSTWPGSPYGNVIATHAFLPARYQDNNPVYRSEALQFGKELIKNANSVIVASHKNCVTEGMIGEIEDALKNGVKVRFIDYDLYRLFQAVFPQMAHVVHPHDNASRGASFFITKHICAHELPWYIDSAMEMANAMLENPHDAITRKEVADVLTKGYEAARGLI